MIERRLDCVRAIDRCRDEVAETRDGLSTIRALGFNALVHLRLGLPYLVRTERSAIGNALAVFYSLYLRGYHNRTLGINLATCRSRAGSKSAGGWRCAAFIDDERSVDAGARRCQGRRPCVLWRVRRGGAVEDARDHRPSGALGPGMERRARRVYRGAGRARALRPYCRSPRAR